MMTPVPWLRDAEHYSKVLAQGGFEGGARDLARIFNVLPLLSNVELSEVVEIILGILTARAERRETAG